MPAELYSIRRLRPLLGTFVEINVQSTANGYLSSSAIGKAFAMMQCVDQHMSVHRKTSDVSRLNRSPENQWISVHPWTAQVLRLAASLHRMSRGAFDLRIRRPTDQPAFLIRGNRVRRAPGATIDLGGIAKGFAVDRAAEGLKRRLGERLISASVNAGGDLRIIGRPRTAALRIPINHGEQLRTVPPFTGAMATSAVRQRRSTRYSSAILRRMPSGRPLKRLRSTTVFANRCDVADALTKLVLTASPAVALHCLKNYRAHAIVFANTGKATVLA